MLNMPSEMHSGIVTADRTKGGDTDNTGLKVTSYQFKPDSYYQDKVVETIPKFLLKKGKNDL